MKVNNSKAWCKTATIHWMININLPSDILDAIRNLDLCISSNSFCLLEKMCKSFQFYYCSMHIFKHLAIM
jgi:hypothetical protein